MASVSSTIMNILKRIIPSRALRKYELFMYSAGISFMALEYITISLLLGIIAGTAVAFFSTFYGAVTFVAVFIGVAFGYPYWKLNKRISEMEKMLPDAFFYLASSLRAGISFSEALEELTTSKFGALTEEFGRVVAEIKKGRPTTEALNAFAVRNQKSSVLYRSIKILIEALDRGAPMSDVLISVGNDVREVLKIKQERKASTGMQTMFFILSSGLIGPTILGIVIKVMDNISGSAVSVSLPVESIRLLIMMFIILQAAVSGLGIGVIREGKFTAGLKYSVLLATMGLLVFKGSSLINLSF
ncbi:type II secretion system F family protein [Thermococcus sp.]